MHEKPSTKTALPAKRRGREGQNRSTARFVQNLRDFDDFYGKEALPVVYCI